MKRNPLVLTLLILFFIFGCAKKSETTLSSSPAVFSNSGPISEADLGVPLYPNGAPDQSQSFSFQPNSKDAHVKTTSTALKTSDSVEKVEIFYRQKLSPNVRISEEPSPAGKLVDIFSNRGGKEIRIQIVPSATPPGSVIVILTQTHT